MRPRPPIIHIVGRKASGKTRLATALIRRLAALGYRVAAVRHSPHVHPIETEGSDTELFRRAGARGTALVTADQASFFLPASGWREKIARVTWSFHDCHLVIMEGGMEQGRDKIEIVSPGEQPLCTGDQGLVALVGQGSSDPMIPRFLPEEIEKICGFIEERYLKPRVSGAVLAGGRSSRLGRNKAFLELQGVTIIERVLQTLARLVSPVAVITNSPDDYRHLGLKTARDILPGGGPLSGIHTALSISPTEHVLILSCDIPLVQAVHVQRLLTEYPGTDITIYKHARFEPLCAVYRRTCLKALEELIGHGEYRIIDLFPTLNVKVIRIDDEEVFRSINTEQDYQDIVKRFQGGRP